MFPNLFNATQEYWRKLDELESAYQQDKISLEEVDLRVSELMAELAQERRSTFNYMRYISQKWLAEQKNTVIGIGILVFATYAWILFSFNNW
ncbi:MAG: hypothetical protein EA365_04875 [Gloeocapsa sp. DLM2.Bin57]|jgi:hypothetical protein|nr:MAG: hypothetical protein EA365_04875 [Gloeocapsa sp. DLM2.Bin57]